MQKETKTSARGKFDTYLVILQFQEQDTGLHRLMTLANQASCVANVML